MPHRNRFNFIFVPTTHNRLRCYPLIKSGNVLGQLEYVGSALFQTKWPSSFSRITEFA
jgi:hypothetical protein